MDGKRLQTLRRDPVPFFIFFVLDFDPKPTDHCLST
ncbi:hypothetical protein MPTK1_1g29000 [Marchantia polymorpha subsp. ruderalis]